ncbi:V-type proton ATPase subunit G [Trichophyton mentagrophytes]|uniref:V-type proton ATPase subunit G n=2 Tax=Trichophyton interdigitale TaxID=101480 RepID=A0A9P4YE82_9EURO|nr:V-type proton ATPase subunit G [Trichophyton interdigitale]KAF3892856.1 V-type proton ATPase subunit G [Trichophyton interdigitale]KAG8207843.1 V-type proton ATPase subunit G [Trichophyton interdigitale]KDB26439.1 V-type ATPase, G subunit [Trichophyton interdigitale MR816]GBF67085.1 V-type proton ATPase subunit G [Trichophyton mentagrophytes]
MTALQDHSTPARQTDETQHGCTKLRWNPDPARCGKGSSEDTREYRTKRIKDAKTEAQKEIEDYKKQKEEEFRKFEAEHSSGNQKAENDANKDAEAQLLEIKKSGKEKGNKVVDDLIKTVLDVNPQVPEKLAKKA